jgi:hypothetical protein
MVAAGISSWGRFVNRSQRYRERGRSSQLKHRCGSFAHDPSADAAEARKRESQGRKPNEFKDKVGLFFQIHQSAAPLECPLSR